MPTPEARRDRIGHLYALLGGEDTLDPFLEGLPRVVVEYVAGTVSCGLTAYKEGAAVAIAGSDEIAADLDQVQDEAGEGPCLEAISTGEPVEVTDPASLLKWPAWRHRAVALRLRKAMSLPLSTRGQALGALNIYSTSRLPFTSVERDAAQRFAAQATGALMMAIRLAEFAELTAHLETALRTRGVIDQAKGVIMAENRCSAEEASMILQRASQNRNIVLRHLAAQIVAGTRRSSVRASAVTSNVTDGPG